MWGIDKMEKKEYTLSFQNAEKSEKMIKKFLLERSDKIKMIIVPIYKEHASWFKKPLEHNIYKKPSFIKFLKSFEKDFINKKSHRERSFGFKYYYEAYTYRLSKKLKSLLQRVNLTETINDRITGLYGFEDPVFYKNNEVIAEIISHEPIFTLYLTENEKKELEKKGTMFDEIMIKTKR